MTEINRSQDRSSTSCPDAFRLATAPTEVTRPGASRRGFLSVMAAVTGGTLAASVLGDISTAQAAPPALTPRPAKRPVAAPAGYQPQTPFGLYSQSVLSEDYFEVTNHQIDVDHGDQVVAYTRTDGAVEGVLLQGGVVKLVYRDASQAGGWAVFALPDAVGVADMVAAVGQPAKGAPYLQISYVKKDLPGTLYVATQPAAPIGAGGPTFTTRSVSWSQNAGPLAVTMVAFDTRQGLEPLVAAMVPTSEDGVGDAQVWWSFGTDSGVLIGFSFSPSDGDRSWSLTAIASQYTDLFQGGFVLQIATQNGTLDLWSLKGPNSGKMARLDVPSPRPPQDNSGMRTVPSDIVSLFNLKFSVTTTLPAALVWTQHQVPIDGGALAGAPKLWWVTFNGNPDRPDWTWTNLAAPANQNAQFDIPVTTALTPRVSAPNSFLLDVFATWDGTLRVVRQIEQGGIADIHTPAFTPLIPLQPDVRVMSSQASPSAGNELMVVGADGTLQTLDKDPVSGAWTDATVHLPASELQQDSSYRVTLTLADTAWNAPVGSHDVKITASTPAVAVVEGLNPKTVVLGALPVTVTTDPNGEVLLALLAEGLSAPTLTITSAGMPSAATINPSEPVNSYMQGGDTLNFLPAMNGATLTGATTPDGQTVAPGAADAGAAGDAATKMKQAADMGAQASLLGAVSSTVGRIDGGRGSHRHHGHHPIRRYTPPKPGNVQLLGSSIDSWGHDVFHAIKKGAAAVEHVTVDIEKSIVSIAVDIAGWADNTVQIVVHSIEDAAHVLHAVFNQLKADIVAAVKWLRALVASLLQDSAHVARELTVLLGQATGFIGDESDSLKAAVETWITGKEQEIQDVFDRLRSGYPKNATLGTIADFDPTTPTMPSRLKRTTRRPTPPPALHDDPDSTPQPHGDWFLNKVKHAIYGQLDTPQFTGLSYDVLEGRLLAACASHLDDLETAAEDFWRFIKTVVTHPSDFTSVVVPALLEAISKLIQAALNLLKAALDALFTMMAALAKAIPDMLETTIGSAGIVGKLLALAGLGDLQIGTVAMMVFAFPTTLAYKIANGPDTRPFNYVTDAQGRLGADPAADRALQITAASVMGVWSGLDVVGMVLEGSGTGVPLLTPAVDLAGPLLVGALAPPFVKDGLPDWQQWTGSTQQTEALISWIFDIVPAFGSAQVLYAKKSAAVDAKTTENSMLWLQTMCGVLSLVAGVLATNKEPNPEATDYATAILLNIPNITASGQTEHIEEATDGLSAIVGAGLGLFAGVAGAAVYGA